MNIRGRFHGWRIGSWCLGLCILPGLLGGCSLYTRVQEGPERVAKDWSRVIRAAQVLPVYPLSEDMRPGDVFLVMKPMARQVEVYGEKGFLPLDFLFMRLDVADLYPKHYPPDYWRTDYGRVPHDRTEPFLAAPRVAFPAYSFASRQDGRIDLPIPVQGVTVGVSLLGAHTVSGTIQLGEAYTYGVGNLALYDLLRFRIKEEGPSSFLRRTRRMLGRDFYLRVVSRVFVVKAIDVLVQRQVVVGGAAQMAVATPHARPVIEPTEPDLVMPEDGVGMKSPVGIPSCSGKVPVGLCVVEWTGQSVTLRERFDRPLVVGYLGFDVPVDAHGRLGALIPSFAVMEQTVTESELKAAIPFVQDPTCLSRPYLRWLKQAGNYRKMSDWLKARRPDVDPEDLYNSPLSEELLPEANQVFGFSPSQTCPEERKTP